MRFFKSKVDWDDGLAVMTRKNPDWADTITRKGKLGGVNVWYARALRLMAFMADDLGQGSLAEDYRWDFRRAKRNVLKKLYHPDGYFRDKEGSNRLDTVASIFGALWLLGSTEALRVEENLKLKVERKSGLQNFSPPYPKKEMFWGHRWLGCWRYHNDYVWPWVFLQNIQVKIKIGCQHRDATVRALYQKEAARDLMQMVELFRRCGSAYEVFEPNESRPAGTLLYTPPKNFMGSMAAWQGAYSQLKKLGWI